MVFSRFTEVSARDAAFLEALRDRFLSHGFSFGSGLYTDVTDQVLAQLQPIVRAGRPEDIAVAGLLASALGFAATFFAISIACDYRYLYALDLSALAGALYGAATFGTRQGPKP